MTTRKKISDHQTTVVICAFCGGQGRDPFGLLSPMAACQVCGSKGKHTLLLPITACAYCRGTGVHPHSRLTCTSCRLVWGGGEPMLPFGRVILCLVAIAEARAW